jgi:hypothetical protein
MPPWEFPQGGKRIKGIGSTDHVAGALIAAARSLRLPQYLSNQRRSQMSKFLSVLVAALFAVVSVNALAAKHMAAEKGAKDDAKKEMKKGEAKKEEGKKKAEEKKK